MFRPRPLELTSAFHRVPTAQLPPDFHIHPDNYLTTDSDQRPIVIVDLVSSAFTANSVSEIVAAPVPNRMPIVRIYIPQHRWEEHHNSVPPCGLATFPWRTSLYTKSVLRSWLPNTPDLQPGEPSVIFGRFSADFDIPTLDYHHTPHKTTHALIKIPWRRRTTPTVFSDPSQATLARNDPNSPPVPATSIADFDSIDALREHHANLWCRVSATEVPYGVDYWILSLVGPLENWAHSFSEIEPQTTADRHTR